MSKRCMGCMEEYDDELEVCPYCGYIEGSEPEIAYHINPEEILVFRYIIGKVLGYGSFGVTYLGWDCLLEKKVAIKEYLPNEFATRAEGTSEVTVFDGDKAQQFTIGKDKFTDEAKKLAVFNKDRSIIAVYDQFEDNGTSYIVMDYFEGETLQQLLNREGKLGYERAIEIILPILKSLQAVHDVNIIHRDISPDNIYLTSDGQVKLLDFGAARYASTNMSKSLSAIYKQGFAPYEQYQSSREQGPWSDVYALAATLYYMITGIIPQEAMNRLTKEEDKLVPPKKLNNDIPKNLSNAIMNAMIVYPAQRTQSVTEFKEEIEDVQTQIKKTKYPKKFLIPKWAKIATGATSTLLVTLCIMIALGVIDVSTLLGSNSKKNLKDNETYIPGLLNMFSDEAEQEAEASDIVMQIVNKVQNEKVAANKIMNQDPKPGLITIKGGLVNVVVSRGKEQAIVPDVTYEREEMAKVKIESAGFKVKIINKQVKGFAEGTVAKQSVAGNKEYGVGGTITLTIAKKGKIPQGKGIVGDYTGKKLARAVKALYKQGLYTVVGERKYDDTVPVGCIISQSVLKDTKLNPGDIVELVVSLGKEKVLVPDVQYTDFESAKAALENLGFIVERDEEESDIVQAGKIIKQSIESGKQVEKGQKIKLVVSKGSQKLVNASKKTEQYTNTVSVVQNTEGKSETVPIADKVKVPEKKWSEWSTDSSKANDTKNYQVETKKQYRSRTVYKKTEMTTSDNPSLPDWTKVSEQTVYGEWKNGNWQRNTAATSDVCKFVQEKTVVDSTYTVYKYFYWRNPNGTIYGPNKYQGWTYYSHEQKTPMKEDHYVYEVGQYGYYQYPGIYFSNELWFSNGTRKETATSHKEYMYATRSKSFIYTYQRIVDDNATSWGVWQENKINKSENDTQRIEVEERTIYRYKQK